MGDANASIPTPQPVFPRPMFGARTAPSPRGPRLSFVAHAALEDGLPDRLGLGARTGARGGRVTARQGRHASRTTRCPQIAVDPDTFAVRIDGDVVEPPPAEELPMAQRYFLF